MPIEIPGYLMWNIYQVINGTRGTLRNHIFINFLLNIPEAKKFR